MSEHPDRSDHPAPDPLSIYVVRVACRDCGGIQDFPVDLAAFIGWAARRIPVQDTFAHLSAPDREYIRSRICPACWTKQFGTHPHHA
ncbi:hypothetical protein [Nocardia sp. NBC_00511]|uniref:hypothetical protein n=1 Tax=Nocardia sp. NBC_00511 TaxID=2903591 RepID=UPI0030E2DD58